MWRNDITDVDEVVSLVCLHGTVGTDRRQTPSFSAVQSSQLVWMKLTRRSQHLQNLHHVAREVVVRQRNDMMRFGDFQFPVSVEARIAQRVVTIDAVDNACSRRTERLLARVSGTR